MIFHFLSRICLVSALLLFVFTLSMCGDNKGGETAETPEKDTAPSVFTVEEQRALKAEYGIQADKRISETNYEEELEKLKKEIENDL